MCLEQPLISIVIPVYNGEKTIIRCVDSVLKQSFERFELIIINDGSNDNTEKILEEYKTKDRRIIVISQSNAGVAAARNVGINRATGKWISFIDADDYLDIDCFKKIFSEEVQWFDLIFWNYYMVSPTEVKSPFIFSSPKEEYTRDELIKCILDNGENQLLSSACCRLFSNQIIKDNKLGFQEGIVSSEDRLFMLDYIMCSEKVLEVRKHLYYRTLNSGSAMHRWHKNAKREYLEVIKLIKERLIKYDKWEICKEIFSIMIFKETITRFLVTYICHIENKSSKKNRKEELKQFLEEEIISEGLKNLNYRNLTIKSLIKLILIKNLGIEILDNWYRNKKYF